VIRDVSGLALAAWLLGNWQQPAPTFRTSADVVRVETLVVENGRPIVGLGAGDFELTDNGIVQTIRVESLGDLPLDVVLAVDVSGSVEGPLFADLVNAGRALVARLRPTDRGALVTFSDAVAVRHPLSEELEPLRATLGRLTAGGGTSVVDAVYAGLAHAERGGRPTLVLAFSDGLDTLSWLRPDQVLEVARRSEVVVDAVIVGELVAPNFTPRDARRKLETRDELERFLEDLARATGGRLLDGGRGERLGHTFTDALAAFRQRYQITYAPTGVETPGWHAIEVKVKGRRNATVRTRAGYSR
jgi:VWFA-related protein